MDYQLNTNAAKAADQFSSRIDTKGRYMGVFTRAEKVESEKGTTGVEFSFKDDSGSTADYLTLWTHNADGKELHGFKILMAIMACLRVKSLTAKNGEVEKYDPAQKTKVRSIVPLFKELMGKPIGLLMFMEEYQKKDLSTNWKPSIAAPFDAAGFSAGEILSQAKTAETIGKMEAALKDRGLRPAAPAASAAPSSGGGVLGDFEDDIPF